MSGIVKLHGTSGSGKTTVARALMSSSVLCESIHGAEGIDGYKLKMAQFTQPLFILGPYNAVCGGMDSISDASRHITLLLKYAELGHVFYEGLLGSEYYGKIGQASEVFGDRHVFAFMDTPIDTCIDRVKARRLARGNTKPLNESNTRGRVKKIERLKERLEKELHRPTVWIDHTNPLPQILWVFAKYDSAA